MINKQNLKNLAVKYQTNYENIAREYLQNLFLRSFYSISGSENFLFKGGTALRIVFKSPRFSEDLDFTGFSDSKSYEKVLESTLYDLDRDGFKVDIETAKVTSGGYLSNIVIDLGGRNLVIKNQISFREKEYKKAENSVIVSDFTPTYNIYLLDRNVIVSEKVNALIERLKPRDFFDLHYICQNSDLKKCLSINESQRSKILSNIEKQDKRHLESELKILLPKSFWNVINDLPSYLKRDL